jgi:hypothetical protein
MQTNLYRKIKELSNIATEKEIRRRGGWLTLGIGDRD